MNNWLCHSMITLLLWGVWGIFGKLAYRSITPRDYIPLVLIGNIIVLIIACFFLLRPSHFKINSTDGIFAVISSIAYVAGGLFFFLALGKGETSKVVLVTALYPIITISYSLFFMNEPVSATKLLGIVTVFIGILFLSV